MKLLNIYKAFFLTYLIFFVLLFNSSVLFAFTEPSYIPVNKPTPIAVKTVGAVGCDFQTLEEADQAAKPGWLIKIKAGNYATTTWNSSGTPGNEIVIEAFTDGDAIINCNGSERFWLEGSYIIFDGGVNKQLIFDGSGQTSSAKIIYPNFATRNNTFSRVIVRNTGRGQTTYDDWGTCGIQGRGDYLKIYNCEIFSSTAVGIYGEDGDYHEIKNNIIHDNCGTGIQYNPHATGVSNDEVTIEGNIIYNNGGCWVDARPGIALLSSTNELYDVYVINNFLWGNQVAGIKKDSGATNSNIRVYNNTIFNNVQNGVWFKDGGLMDIKNNIVYNNGATADENWASWGDFGRFSSSASKNLTTNPNFLSTKETDAEYLLLGLASTDAIDKGEDLLSKGITADIFAGARPTGSDFDIGGHEYGSIPGSPPPAVPGNPSSLRVE